ncbi:ATP-binding protein [Streptomyces sp. NPDC051576]|uniref:ATP-binding protein n=1 Tax=Streptomyces sp. NPDC051576 TaxID=3155803 RepID=UPI00341721A8
MSSPAHQVPRVSGTAAPSPDPTAPLDAPRRLHQKPTRSSSRTAALRLPGTAQGCARARDFTRLTLGNWDLDHCRADALAVIAELAANAVVHALPHTPDGDAEVWVKLTQRANHLVCAVIDPSDSPPVYRRTGDPLDEDGRGLRIVDALSEHWGWTKRYRAGGTRPAGKTVWAMLATGPRT